MLCGNVSLILVVRWVAASGIGTGVRLYLCRDQTEALRSVLKPHSLVVIGGNRGWWPTREKRLARQLRRAGHEVVFAEV